MRLGIEFVSVIDPESIGHALLSTFRSVNHAHVRGTVRECHVSVQFGLIMGAWDLDKKRPLLNAMHPDCPVDIAHSRVDAFTACATIKASPVEE